MADIQYIQKTQYLFLKMYDEVNPMTSDSYVHSFTQGFTNLRDYFEMCGQAAVPAAF